MWLRNKIFSVFLLLCTALNMHYSNSENSYYTLGKYTVLAVCIGWTAVQGSYLFSKKCKQIDKSLDDVITRSTQKSIEQSVEKSISPEKTNLVFYYDFEKEKLFKELIRHCEDIKDDYEKSECIKKVRSEYKKGAAHQN